MNILSALVNQERLAARRGQLEEDRRDAIDHYLGRPYGDEVEGRSQVVMRDVADTIEWIKPSLLKIFAAGDEVVRFEPVGPEDEQQAEQETDYCNHVLMSRNNGFLILHDWFHDALLQRNGYVWVQSVTKRRQDLERYSGLTDDEFTLLLQSEGLELVEHQQVIQEQMTTAGPVQIVLHDCAVRCVVEYPCLQITNIPPERVLVAPDWAGVDLDGCPFVEVIDYKTVSQLREEGYDVDDNISDQDETEDVDDETWRNVNEEEDYDGRRDLEADPATRRLRVRYVWMRYDEDGDGIAELRRMVVVGSTILENEEDALIPVAALTPGRLPHEHVGQSVDDWVNDLQRIRTVLVRGFLDNMYLSMHGRNAIDVTRVNLDDLLVVRAGGIVRVQGDPSSAIMPMVQANNGQGIIQAIEYVDTVRENRTGVTKYNQGLDANSLNKTAQGINQIMTASQQRIELIARMFAETGVRALMLIIHAMSIKHGRQREIVKLRNQWVPVDPRGWKNRRDVTVSVGIGTGSKDQMLGHLMALLQQQQQALAAGMPFVSPQNVYATLRRLIQNMGFKNVDEFLTDPAQVPPQQPQPDPNQMKLQAEMQMKQAQLQMDGQKLQAEMQAKQQSSAIELEKARVELQIKQADLELRRQELQLKAQEAELEARISMQRAAMHASDDMARAEQIRGQ